MLRSIVIDASVTMNGAMLNLVMQNPANAPESAPTAIPANATSEPTERSIPPVSITNVIPAAIMAVMEACSETFSKLSGVKK